MPLSVVIPKQKIIARVELGRGREMGRELLKKYRRHAIDTLVAIIYLCVVNHCLILVSGFLLIFTSLSNLYLLRCFYCMRLFRGSLL